MTAIAAVAAMALTGALVLGSGPSAADTSTPPWQQAGQSDPNEVGTLTFYDTNGAPVTSGSVNDDPIFAYAVGSTVLRSGDTKATLYGALPKNGQAQGAWTTTQLSGSTVYPPTGAPSSISTTLPVFTGSPSDDTIADLVATTPNKDTSTDGYAGLYELRVKTGASGLPPTTSYDAADIAVNGSSWQVVYPVSSGATTTTLAANPTSGAVDTATTLTATVSPSATPGTVQFTDGAVEIGSPVTVSGGIATTTWIPTTVGDHALKASFTPDSTSSATPSNGSLTYTASKATATVAGTWSTTTPTYGRGYTVSATVTAHGITPTGTVRLLRATTVLGTATLTKGKATISVKGTSLAPGTYTEVLSYGGNSLVSGAAVSKRIVVHPAASTTKIKLAYRKRTTKQRDQLAITVSAYGVYPSGTIYIYRSAKGAKFASVKFTSKAKGKVTVTLPLFGKAGNYAIHARYLGSSLVRASTSASETLTVRKA